MEKLRRYLSYCFWFCIAIIDIRIIEIIFSTYYVGEFWQHMKNNSLGLCFDISYFCLVSSVLAPLYIVVSRRSEKIVSILFRLVSTFALYIGLFLVMFYAQARFPLDRVLFLYSIDEIKETIVNSSVAPWWMYTIVLLYPVVFFFASRIKVNFTKRGSVIVGILMAFCIFVRLVCYDKSVGNQDYPEQSNKFCYLLRSTLEGFSEEEFNNGDMEVDFDKFHSYFPNRQFVSNKCPFLHKKDTSNVLAPFFYLDSVVPPNIVIVIVEGLGFENSGKYSKYVSATPFLDSLAEKSLSWQNCLSVSQRTFGVLPGVFGALPFGRGGFMAYKKNAPDFYSIPKFLTENGYDFSFYYGGWCAFDDMNHFIDLQNGKQCFEQKYDSLAPRNKWGLLDKFMFTEAVNDINFESVRPRLDVFLTLTSHAPWDYPDKESYIKQYETASKKQNKPMSPNTAASASYLYVDEALRQLFLDYGKKKGFDNTIFIVTGDHNYDAGTYILERYHVPLIVWSPMLKKTLDSHALVSHRDIPHSIISLLVKKYNMKSPDNVAWINGSLDTVREFHTGTFIPQADPSRNIVSFVYNDYFVYNNECYTIHEIDHSLSLEKLSNKLLADSIMQLYETYKKIDMYVCSFNALIDTTKTSFSKKELIQKKSWNFSELFSGSGKIDTAVATGEFIDLVSFPLRSSYTLLNPCLVFDCSAQSEVAQEPMLVIAVKDSHQQQLFWESYPIKMKEKEWLTYKFNDMMPSLSNFTKDGNTIALYIWNPANVPLEITNLSLSIYDITQ